MTYTVKITETNPKATDIINMLKMLASDYDFVQIYEEDLSFELTPEQEKELDSRYEYVLKNPKEGKNWEEVKENLLSK